MNYTKKKKVIVGRSITLEVDHFYTSEGKVSFRNVVGHHCNKELSSRSNIDHLKDPVKFEAAVKSAFGNQE